MKGISLWVFLVFGILLSGSFFSCGGGEKALSTAEKIARTWQVGQVLVNGSEDIANDYSGFRVTFQLDRSGNPSTYNLTPGGAPSRPNYNHQENSGVWVLGNGNISIIFDETSTVSIIGEPTEAQLTLEWTLPEEKDKTLPTYRYVLIPVN